MARIFADRVREITMSTGTDPLTLAGVPTVDYLPWSAKLPIGETAPGLVIAQGRGQWEVVDLTMLPDGRLDRSPTPSSSSNGGAPVSFGPGRKEVILVATAADIAAAMDAVAGALAGQEGAEAAKVDAEAAKVGAEGARDDAQAAVPAAQQERIRAEQAATDAAAVALVEGSFDLFSQADAAKDGLAEGHSYEVTKDTDANNGIWTKRSGVLVRTSSVTISALAGQSVSLLSRVFKRFVSRRYADGFIDALGRMPLGFLRNGGVHIHSLLLGVMKPHQTLRWVPMFWQGDRLLLGYHRVTGKLMGVFDDPVIANFAARSGLTDVISRVAGIRQLPAWVKSRFYVIVFSGNRLLHGVDRVTGLTQAFLNPPSVNFLRGKLNLDGVGAAGPPALQIVATRGHIISPAFSDNMKAGAPAATCIFTRNIFQIGPWDVGDVQFVFGTGTGQAGKRGEREWPNPVQIEMGYEPFVANALTDLTYRKVMLAGRSSFTLDPGATSVATDILGVALPAASFHYTRVKAKVNSGELLPVTGGGNRYAGLAGADESTLVFAGDPPSSPWGTGSLDATGAITPSAPAPSLSTVGINPQLIIGRPRRRRQAWGILLTSIPFGTGDTVPNMGSLGWVTDGLLNVGGKVIPWSNLAIAGSTYRGLFMGNSGVRMAALRYCPCLLLDAPINDFIFRNDDGISFQQTIDAMDMAIRAARAEGVEKIAIPTMTPRTDSENDHVLDAAAFGSGGLRDQFNTLARGGYFTGRVDYILDVAALVAGKDMGGGVIDYTLWKSKARTADGIHPSSSGSVEMAPALTAAAVDAEGYFSTKYPD